MGGIVEKAVVVDGRVKIHELLSVTAGSDRDIVEGAPAAPVAQRVKEMIERGYGLDVLAL